MIDCKSIKVGDLLFYQNDTTEVIKKYWICCLVLESFPQEEKIVDFSFSNLMSYEENISTTYTSMLSIDWQHIKCDEEK